MEGLIKLIEDRPSDKGANDLLREIRDYYELKHITYVGIDLPQSFQAKQLVSATTYPEAWQKHYIESNYISSDPTIKKAVNSLLPVDWADVEKKSALSKRLFGEAKEFGIAETGLSFTIRGASGETALLTVNSDFSPETWAEFKRENMANLQIIAYYLHKKMMEINNISFDVPKLSKREIECLYWASRGKTYRDVAEIVGLSDHTVKMYFSTARYKLNCLTLSHAIAKAISLRIIAPII